MNDWESDWERCGLEKFKALCKKNKIKFELTPNYIKYRTNVEAWLIELNSRGKSLSLWHLSKFNRNANFDKFNDYHLQKTYPIDEKVLESIFKYTYYHGKSTLSTVGKLSDYDIHMEKLFSKIKVKK